MSQYTGSTPDTEPGRTWLKEAACRAPGINPETFFPNNNLAGIDQARAICKTCPVRRACLADCLRHERGSKASSRWGVYAGLTPRQRERLWHKLRARRKANRARGSKAAA
jgi:WhiB family redox-sensing transcriptional regulator